MASANNHVNFRLALIDADSRETLALSDGKLPRLIQISMPPGIRLARYMQSDLERKWNVHAVVIDFLPFTEARPQVAVAELLSPAFPPCFRRIRLEDLSHTELSESERRDVSAILQGEAAGPVSRIGWIEKAVDWFKDVTGHRSFAKDAVEQYNAGRGFSLLRFRTEVERTFWLKATSCPNMHERELTKTLSKICPASLPEWIAEKPEWNAWLTLDHTRNPKTVLNDSHAIAHFLEQATTALGELQRSTIGMENWLFASGAFDQRASTLRANAGALFAFIREAMEHQASTKVSPIGSNRLDEIQRIFEDACSIVEGADVPSTIVHGDMNAGNVLLVDGACHFIDWSEGYVGHPFVTLQHLLLLNNMGDDSERAAVNRRVTAAYAETMEGAIPSRQIETCLASMPLLAAGAALYGRGDWLRAAGDHDTRRFEFARRIARHMDAAARERTSTSVPVG